ncbi:MAG: DUF2203 family protein [Aquificae bacterium]|nr:DUF2203 family protein [Aquificota bacterium]
MRRVMSLREAKETFLRIKPIADSLVRKKESLMELKRSLTAERDELEAMYLKTRIKELEVQIRRHVARIEELGGEVVQISPLFVSFPVKMRDRLLWLSWREGEEGINYWYGPGEDPSQRKPLELLWESEEIP